MLSTSLFKQKHSQFALLLENFLKRGSNSLSSDALKGVLSLDAVQNDRSLFHTLDCHLVDLQRKVRHCGVYVSRCESSEQPGEWHAGTTSQAPAAASDASVRLQTVRTLSSYDFASDTLLSGLSTSEKQWPQAPANARKRPKEVPARSAGSRWLGGANR